MECAQLQQEIEWHQCPVSDSHRPQIANSAADKETMRRPSCQREAMEQQPTAFMGCSELNILANLLTLSACPLIVPSRW